MNTLVHFLGFEYIIVLLNSTNLAHIILYVCFYPNLILKATTYTVYFVRPSDCIASRIASYFIELL